MSTTETKVRHTPLPWRHVWNRNAADVDIRGPKHDDHSSELIATIHNNNDRDDNAKFIVRAVNSYADMLEALEDALALIENGLEMMDKEPLEVAAAAREAIARAKGGAA